MIFVTVGTQFPFDRLIKAIDAAIIMGRIDQEVFAQTCCGSYRPRHFATADSLEKESFDAHIKRATAIVSHAGIGSITVAMAHAKPLLVMPRLKKYGEAVNDHQVEIARRFAEAGHLLLAEDEQQFLERITALPLFVPAKRFASPELVSHRVADYLNKITI